MSLLATLRRHGPDLALTALGTLLALAGVTSAQDSIVHYVFAIVDGVAWDPWSLLQPIYNPEPMYTHAYRPLSTTAVKLGGLLFGRDAEGMARHQWAHGLALAPFGWAARRALRAHGVHPISALLAAAAAMLSPTLLFSAWTIPEFDLVGAIPVLFAMSGLRTHGLSRPWRVVPWALLALLTKETTAILMLAYLIAWAWDQWPRSPRIWAVPLAYGGLLLLAVLPILLRTPPTTHAFNVTDPGFDPSRIAWLGAHLGSQVFYVLGAGATLLLGQALATPRLRWPLLVGSVLAYALAPPLQLVNHYESVVFSHPTWVGAWGGTALAFLVAHAFGGHADRRLLARATLLGLCALLAGPVLASFTRADLSARLLAPLIPLLYGLALEGARLGWAATERWHRAVVVLPAAAFAWMPLAGAWSASALTQSRFAVEADGKREVIAALAPPCPMVFTTNRDQEWATEEIDALGFVDSTVRSCATFVQLAVTELGPGRLWDYPIRLQGVDEGRRELTPIEVEAALRYRLPMSRSVYLHVLTLRSAMSDAVNGRLAASFEWAVNRLPEADRGTFQQSIGLRFVTETPLERTFAERATLRRERRSAIVPIVPLWLEELPMRLLTGLPWVEAYRFESTLYGIPGGVTPNGEAGVIRVDSNDRAGSRP